MIDITIDGVTLERLIAGLRRAPDQIQDALQRFGDELGAHLVGEVVDRTPMDTGILRLSIHALGAKSLITGLGVEVVVTSNERYAVPVELGSKPHVIKPKNAKALAFTIGGRKIIRKSVNHPGTKGAQMFERALQANKTQINAQLINALDRVLSRLGV